MIFSKIAATLFPTSPALPELCHSHFKRDSAFSSLETEQAFEIAWTNLVQAEKVHVISEARSAELTEHPHRSLSWDSCCHNSASIL